MTTHEPITDKTWPKGSPLPKLNAACPRCGNPLTHYINYSQSIYVVACFFKTDEVRQTFCAYNIRRPISITGKKAPKDKTDNFGAIEEKRKIKAVKPRQWKRGFKPL